jgi:hypothetical protein
MASQVELFCDQGSTFSYTIDIANDDGTKINVAGYSFSSSIRKSYYSNKVAANLTVATTDAANGNVALSMNAATTANIKAGRYLYDVRMVDTSNVVTRVIEGVITVYPQVTKS